MMKMIFPTLIGIALIACNVSTKQEIELAASAEVFSETEPILIIKDNGVATWKIYVNKITDEEYELQFKAIIKDKWHIYAINLPSDEGPLPTSFDFLQTDGLEIMGKIMEDDAIRVFDHNFGVDVMYFEKEPTFRQMVKVSSADAKVKGAISYMACDDERCIPPVDVPFEFDLF